MSIARMQRDRQAALAVLFKAWSTYQTRSFVVDPKGRNFEPLKIAEKLGWCWWSGGRCGITAEGLRELEPYRRDEPQVCVQWICPVCLDVVGQLEDENGLPERASCPSCAKLTHDQIEAMVTARERKSA
jgi:hypothetical protein